MAPAVLHRVIHGNPTPQPWQASLLTIRPAILPDHCRHRVRNCDYPAITPEADSSVRGTFVSGLTEGDIWRLDIFEGDEYARRKVRLRVLSDAGEEFDEAETYVWVAGREKLEGGEWDFEAFRREKMGAWVGGGDGADGGFAGRWTWSSLSLVRWRGGCCVAGEERTWTDVVTEVDKAVRAAKPDPTGGRGVNGTISTQLEGARGREALESAV